MRHWPSPKRNTGYRHLPDWIREDAECSVPERARLKLSVRQQVELGLTHCDEIPERPSQCCFVPNNTNYIMPLRGTNPCHEPPEPDCCELGDFG